MAGWITHLLTAQQVRQNLQLADEHADFYYLGTLAPDSGDVAAIEDGKRIYDPPRVVSHWTQEHGVWDSPIRYERFYHTYLDGETDPVSRAFYLGYWVHLLTDSLWMEVLVRPVLSPYLEPEAVRVRTYHTLRTEWTQVEAAYFRRHPGLDPYRRICEMEVPDRKFLDYLAPNRLRSIAGRLRSIYEAAPAPPCKLQLIDDTKWREAVRLVSYLVTANYSAR